jgi:hypothetical protein
LPLFGSGAGASVGVDGAAWLTGSPEWRGKEVSCCLILT